MKGSRRPARCRERDSDREDAKRAADLYDSFDQRRDAAAALEGIVDDETIQARVVADTSHTRPAQDAVAKSPTRVPTARRARGKGSQVRTPARRTDRGR